MSIENVRNIALVGHGNAGKTSLGEACLHLTGVTNRLGSVTEKSTLLDFTDEEKAKQHSLETAACTVTHAGCHINILDTPGSPDFCGQSIPALAGAELAVVVVSGASGMEVNTRKMFERAKEYGIGIAFIINKIDVESFKGPELIQGLQETFGPQCLPVNLPAPGGKSVIAALGGTGATAFGDLEAAHTAVVEAIVGVDDALMEKYLGGEVSDDEARSNAVRAVAAGTLMPIMFTCAKTETGVKEFLDAVVAFGPSPLSGKRRQLVTDEGVVEVDPKGPAGDLVGQVFKVTSDPKSNIKYSYLRIFAGTLRSDGAIYTVRDRKGLRPGQVFRMMGGEHRDLPEGTAGDIVALAKLDLKVGDVVFTHRGGTIEMPRMPQPMYSLAIEPKTRGDEDKIANAFKRFAEEDPCFVVERNSATRETVIRGVGDVQLRSMLHKLSTHYKVEVETRPPRIPYRETIAGSARDIEYTHKKQTGGAGQYGKVVINLEPNQRGAGYEFVDKIFGGAIDQPFRVSVDKGIHQQLSEGVLAGYPIVDVRVELTDGKTHPVDSKDIAFQIAGRGAFKEAFMKSKPVLLEPIVNIEVTVPMENLGDIQGDLASRRGQPIGQDMLPGQMAVLKARVPLGEVADYHSRLSSITGGRGSYSLELSHYEQVPALVQQRIVAEHDKHAHAPS